MATNVYKGVWWKIILAPGHSTTWWFTWGFNSSNWVRFDACPDSDQSVVEIVRQWAEKDIHGTVLRRVVFKNIGSTTVAFTPKCLKG